MPVDTHSTANSRHAISSQQPISSTDPANTKAKIGKLKIYNSTSEEIANT